MQNYKTVKWFQMSKVRCWSSVQLLSCVQPCDPMDWSTPGLRVHHNLLELTEIMSIKSVMPSSHLILCHPLSPPPSVFPGIRVFSMESVFHIKWPKYWSFSFSTSPSNEYSGLIFFRIHWFDSPCSPKDLQESSPTPQFKSINSKALSFLYSPTLTFIHDYRKNHSLD